MLIKQNCLNCGVSFEAHDWRHRKYCTKRCKGLYDKSGQYKPGNVHSPEIEAKRIKALRENPSYGMLGKKHTEETKKRMSENSKFPYNYIDGGYRKKIDDSKCSKCGKKKMIIKNVPTIGIHHIDGNRKNNNKENLMALCHKCHMHTHYPDGKWGINLKR